MANNEKVMDSPKKEKKATSIINQYQYTDVLMEEVQDAWAKQTFRNYIPLIIIGLICIFFTWRESVTHKATLAILFALVGICCFAAIIASFISTVKNKNAAIQQFHEAYHGKGFEYKITIEGSHICSYKDGAESINLRKRDIRGTMETERFFVFQLSGEQLLPLKKDAFLKGDIKSCRNYIPQVKR